MAGLTLGTVSGLATRDTRADDTAVTRVRSRVRSSIRGVRGQASPWATARFRRDFIPCGQSSRWT